LVVVVDFKVVAGIETVIGLFAKLCEDWKSESRSLRLRLRLVERCGVELALLNDELGDIEVLVDVTEGASLVREEAASSVRAELVVLEGLASLALVLDVSWDVLL